MSGNLTLSKIPSITPVGSILIVLMLLLTGQLSLKSECVITHGWLFILPAPTLRNNWPTQTSGFNQHPPEKCHEPELTVPDSPFTVQIGA